jgi:hypothetical protein
VTRLKSIMIIFSMILWSWWSASLAQVVGSDDGPSSIRSAAEAIAADGAGGLEEAAEAATRETSTLKETRLDPEAAFEMLEIIDLDAVDRGKYVASIEFSNPLNPHSSGKRGSSEGGRFLLGLRRPYYSLDETVRVMGSFDLKASGAVAGLVNGATLTFRYDLKGDMERRAFKLSMLIDQVSYMIVIPFGKP